MVDGVVDGAEAVAEVLVRQVGQRPAVGRAAGLELGRRDQQRGDEAAGDQEDAHDHGGRGQQPPGAADPARRAARRSSSASPRTCGITATPVSKPDRPSASLGKTSSAMPTTISGLPCWVVSAVRPVGDHSAGLADHLPRDRRR